MVALKLQKRAARVDFDWDGPAGVMDKLHEEIAEFASAETEEERVEEAICAIGDARSRKVIAWSITEGFTSLDGGSNFSDIRDPLRALDFIANYEDDVIAVLRDYHPYLKDPSIVRRLRDLHRAFKDSDYAQHVVLLSALFNAPVELEKELAVDSFNKCLNEAAIRKHP